MGFPLIGERNERLEERNTRTRSHYSKPDDVFYRQPATGVDGAHAIVESHHNRRPIIRLTL